MMGDVTDPFDGPDVPLTERPPSRKSNVMAATGLLSSLLIATLTVMPANFAIADAGPTFDVLASNADGEPIVSLDGAESYDTSGELRLTTVSYSRAHTRAFSLGSVVEGFLSPRRTVYPDEFVFGTPEEQEQESVASAQAWTYSQETATVAALEQLGWTVPATTAVAGVLEGSNATGLLEENDVITAVDGVDLVTYGDLTTALAVHAPGDDVTLTIDRAGQTQDVTFALIASDEDPSVARMGIYVVPTFDLPVTVNVDIYSVSGPSGGLMFALGIMDKLTPQDELDGAKIAGTGTIDVDGTVGPIGGIQHKMDGAVAAGADYFLAPLANCDEVVGHVPAGLDVYAVDTLADAYDAIVAIGKQQTSGLPTCSAASSKE